MSVPRLVFLHTPEIEAFPYPADCPFKTERAPLARRRLISLGLLGGPGQEEAPFRKATDAELCRIHTPDYLDELRRAAAGDLTVDALHLGIGGADTPVFASMFDYGAWACGAGLTGCEMILQDQADIVFNLYGGLHHAKADRAGGFCYLNDVALACLHLAESGKRVAYLDLDAHHGDGVQSILYERGDVLKISLHESGHTLFPWGGFENETGDGPGTGCNVNIPLPADVYDEAYMNIFREVALPLLGAYQPDCLVLAIGMDILAGDPLTHLRLSNNVVADCLRDLLPLHRPMLITGSGGYHVANCVRGWSLAWSVCLGEDQHDAHFPVVGGNMLANSDWAGGLRDPLRPVLPEQRAAADPPLHATRETLRRTVFPCHGLPVTAR